MQRIKIYRMTEFIGRWSMVDIFVVSLMAALVQLQNLMAVYPGPAAVSFAIVVIFTMLSAMVFDPRDLWQNPSEKDSGEHVTRDDATREHATGYHVTSSMGEFNGMKENER